jgi:hypothetical protein
MGALFIREDIVESIEDPSLFMRPSINAHIEIYVRAGDWFVK